MEVVAFGLTSHMGTVEPVGIGPGGIWLDTSTSPAVIKVRNQTDDGWISTGAQSVGATGPPGAAGTVGPAGAAGAAGPAGSVGNYRYRAEHGAFANYSNQAFIQFNDGTVVDPSSGWDATNKWWVVPAGGDGDYLVTATAYGQAAAGVAGALQVGGNGIGSTSYLGPTSSQANAFGFVTLTVTAVVARVAGDHVGIKMALSTGSMGIGHLIDNGGYAAIRRLS